MRCSDCFIHFLGLLFLTNSFSNLKQVLNQICLLEFWDWKGWLKNQLSTRNVFNQTITGYIFYVIFWI